MTHLPSRLCLSDLRHSVPCKNRASTILAALPRCAASYPLPVRQASALPSASSRFAVTRDTLAVRLTLPLAGRVEDFHLKAGAPCRAHQQKTGLEGRFLSTYWWRSGPQDETCARSPVQSRSQGQSDRRDCAEGLHIPAAPLGARNLEPDDAARCAPQPRASS